MYTFQSFLQDLSSSTGIKFNLIFEDGNFKYSGLEGVESSEIISSIMNLGTSRVILEILKREENCTALLRYTIENKYREIFSMREQTIIEVLEGKETSAESVGKDIPFISKGCTLFLIKVDGSRFEALNIVRQLYSQGETISFIYKNCIVLLGYFEDIDEHAQSIKGSIESDLYCKCYVSYGNPISNIKDIKKAYEEALECFSLRKNFGLKEEIFFYDKMLFEKIVYNINPQVKSELFNRFKDKFNSFDSEIINTIEEFVNCDLNVSDAARKLYVHRNTLIYRLDKITKETGFDIRNFREAAVFIIAFLIWKENKTL